MARRRPRLTLGGHIRARRTQLGLSQVEAARRAGVTRATWCAWESDDPARSAVPDDRNHRLIEEFCDWEPGSVVAVLDGGAPTPVRRAVASVTELHPGTTLAPPDDELIRELRAMELPEEFISNLIDAYRAEKAHADTQRHSRYLGIAREASG